MAAEKYWFADIDEKEDGPWKWRPFLQDGGCVSSLDLWFETEDACLAWIATIPAGKDVSAQRDGDDHGLDVLTLLETLRRDFYAVCECAGYQDAYDWVLDAVKQALAEHIDGEVSQ